MDKGRRVSEKVLRALRNYWIAETAKLKEDEDTMEAEVDEDDGMFTNISLADDPGKAQGNIKLLLQKQTNKQKKTPPDFHFHKISQWFAAEEQFQVFSTCSWD